MPRSHRQRARRHTAPLVLLVAAILVGCGAELPVSLTQPQLDACDYHHLAQQRFDVLVGALREDLKAGDPVAVVLSYEAPMAEAAELLPEGDEAAQVPLLLASSYKEFLFALGAARDGDGELARYYAESFVTVVHASPGASAGC
jgi:hypothetical protein